MVVDNKTEEFYMRTRQLSKVQLLGITCGALLILYTIADVIFINNIEEYFIPFTIGFIAIVNSIILKVDKVQTVSKPKPIVLVILSIFIVAGIITAIVI